MRDASYLKRLDCNALGNDGFFWFGLVGSLLGSGVGLLVWFGLVGSLVWLVHCLGLGLVCFGLVGLVWFVGWVLVGLVGSLVWWRHLQPAKCGAKFRLVGSWHCNALTDGQRWAAAELHNVTDTADMSG